MEILYDFSCGCELWEIFGPSIESEPSWRPCDKHKSQAEIELAQLREDCAPFMAQIEQRKTYQVEGDTE